MRQLDVELRRFFARRIVRGAALLAVLIIVVTVTTITVRGHEAAEPEIAVTPGTLIGPDGQPVDTSISSSFGGKVDTRIDVHKTLKPAIEGTGVALLLTAIVLGASFVGAEFNVGSLTSQLLYEPRRWRVHLAKSAAVLLGAFVVTFAVLTVLSVAMYLGSEAKGIVYQVDGAFWRVRFGDIFRVAAAAGCGGAMAYALTLVARRSSAAITIFMIQFPLIGIISPDNKVFGPVSKYAPVRGLLAMIHNPRLDGDGALGITTQAAGVVLVIAWVVLLVAACGAYFGRAEVR
jgi:hypothetical protein